MGETQGFSFGDDSVESAYCNVLVKILFEPWAAGHKATPFPMRRKME
ncbi:MAG: hypothetical protein WBH40_16630 [Ignavibacteriaceae bacterium]|jgi:hypothetical protein